MASGSQNNNKIGAKSDNSKKVWQPKVKQNPINTCEKCGFNHKKGKYPAYGKACLKCNKLNNFAKMCRSKVVHDDSNSESE